MFAKIEQDGWRLLENVTNRPIRVNDKLVTKSGAEVIVEEGQAPINKAIGWVYTNLGVYTPESVGCRWIKVG